MRRFAVHGLLAWLLVASPLLGLAQDENEGGEEAPAASDESEAKSPSQRGERDNDRSSRVRSRPRSRPRSKPRRPRRAQATPTKPADPKAAQAKPADPKAAQANLPPGKSAPAQRPSLTPAPRQAQAASPPASSSTPARAVRPNGRAAPAQGAEFIEMNFRNVDLVNFLSTMSTALGIAMVWDEKDIKGKITLVSPKRFLQEDAAKIFQTILTLHGYTTIEVDRSPVVQVIPLKDASRIPSPTRTEIGGQEERNIFLTQIIPLRYADANLVKAALTPIISKSAALAVYQPANVILLTDRESNLRRVLAIVKELDVAPGDVEFRVIQLQHISAKKLAPILTNLISTGKSRPRRKGAAAAAAETEAKVVGEDHTNSIIIVADRFTMSQLRRLIRALDVPALVEDRNMKVYRLEHADAEALQKVLSTVRQGTTAKKGEQVAGGIPDATITADKPTNSLIVFGPPETLATMDEMIAELDIRRPQVFVEAMIMEMTLEKSLQLGVSWQGTAQAGNAALGLGVPSATPQTLAQTLATGAGAVVGVVGNEIEFQGQSFPSFSAFIRATRQDQDLNILANPQILTMNNEEATINVSQVIPISSKILRDANQNTTTEFTFKDIGIILSITPQITGQDKVRLIIDQESSSVAARQSGVSAQQAITTLKRSLKTKVLVDNDSTIAIGGLIQDQQVENVTKVPCLGDIPVLGWFFRSRSEEVRKTNLIVFIRPRIIINREDLEELSEKVESKYDQSRSIGADTETILRQDFNLEIEGEEFEESTRRRRPPREVETPPPSKPAKPARRKLIFRDRGGNEEPAGSESEGVGGQGESSEGGGEPGESSEGSGESSSESSDGGSESSEGGSDAQEAPASN